MLIQNRSFHQIRLFKFFLGSEALVSFQVIDQKTMKNDYQFQ